MKTTTIIKTDKETGFQSEIDLEEAICNLERWWQKDKIAELLLEENQTLWNPFYTYKRA